MFQKLQIEVLKINVTANAKSYKTHLTLAIAS